VRYLGVKYKVLEARSTALSANNRNVLPSEGYNADTKQMFYKHVYFRIKLY